MTRRLLSAFVLPPGIFVTLFAAAGLWHLRKGRRSAAAAHFAIGSLAWLISVPPGADLLVRGLEASYEEAREPRGDVIVLVGGGVHGGAPDFSGTGAPSEEM